MKFNGGLSQGKGPSHPEDVRQLWAALAELLPVQVSSAAGPGMTMRVLLSQTKNALAFRCIMEMGQVLTLATA